MNKDDIVRMAQSVRDWGHWDQDDLVRFAALVAVAEREACARMCEERAESGHHFVEGYAEAEGCAEAIRARGECKHCKDFLSKFRCAKETHGECDCPKCQGYCQCN